MDRATGIPPSAGDHAWPLPPPDPLSPRVREGPSFARPSSPPWDLTSLRIRRSAKRAFERFRYEESRGGRILPHWEAFELLLAAAGRR